MSDYNDLLKQVNSKETFLRFLKAFIADLHDSEEQEIASPSSPYSPNANDWENPTLARFLEAMHVWCFTSYALSDEPNVPEEPSWRTFAEMFAAAKVYE